MKEIIYELDFIKINNLLFAKDGIKRLRRQTMDWEKIYAKGTSDKGLLSKACTERLILTIKKTNNAMEKWTEDFNRYLTQVDIQMTSNHEKMLHVICQSGNTN